MLSLGIGPRSNYTVQARESTTQLEEETAAAYVKGEETCLKDPETILLHNECELRVHPIPANSNHFHRPYPTLVRTVELRGYRLGLSGLFLDCFTRSVVQFLNDSGHNLDQCQYPNRLRLN
ncbi:hypothetical protein CRM22_003028 [Opisthorchis felineus]|uniref:Uncharacterized protein n=1 Tax=Opisthorchis felineus TaxID=147828 RepID=A0A4V3SG34_OPIFE|nr:hypothetical protein CRM22_003028 [Opisthorchis felineus]